MTTLRQQLLYKVLEYLRVRVPYDFRTGIEVSFTKINAIFTYMAILLSHIIMPMIFKQLEHSQHSKLNGPNTLIGRRDVAK